MSDVQRLKVVIKGAVQGVGFRPFVFKLAKSLSLPGWINNSSQGVFIEVEGFEGQLQQFILRLNSDKPIHAFIQSFESTFLDPVGFKDFEIKKSEESGEKTVVVLPDIATCDECLAEVFDARNRRYLYPFTNCTLCGPRYSIIESLPYDRPSTTMKRFEMCPDCQREYEDPNDRRFHAQPNACPVCGPKVYACNTEGDLLAEAEAAFSLIVERLLQGDIVGLKGLGGFHLMADAGNEAAVEKLRVRKRRNEKPFAVMMTSLLDVESVCEIDDKERRLLLSPESPIVLLQRKHDSSELSIGENVAPNNPTLGVMLPYTPLHHILMRKVKIPLVATSGNFSDEPICISETEALQRLGKLADVFLFHDRPIIRHVDDSVVRIMAGREMVMRRARGFAPLPVSFGQSRKAALAVGAHQKNTVAFQVSENTILSQHLGDLETVETLNAFNNAILSLQNLYEVEPELVVCDLHSDYMSTKYAKATGLPVKEIQHHHAHIASCMAENQLTGTVLGVSWDGTGAGDDGAIWGGEFLLGDERKMERFASLKQFRLPGADKVAREPRRSAMGVLFEVFEGELSKTESLEPSQSFSTEERKLIEQILKSGFNSPYTSSAGRLFDAVSSIIGIRQVASFEGQGAMELEFQILKTEYKGYYRFEVDEKINWIPMIKEIIYDRSQGVSSELISARFHNTLAEIIVAVALKAGVEKVLLSGGCFQNRYLTEKTIKRLKEEGFTPYWHQRVPPNDGGIALGQIYAGA